MKRTEIWCMTALLLFSLAGCAAKEEVKDNSAGEEIMSAPEEASISDGQEDEAGLETGEEIPSGGSNILIAYFSVPEDVETVDAVAGASVVVKDNERMGNTEYVAKTIQKTVGGDLFRIDTVEAYPLDHDPLVDQAADEQNEGKRPELLNNLENYEQYEVILLGFPNWWADLPMPVYTFLEEYDFGGKTIIPFVTHGGSGFSGTLNTISRLQPGAHISENALSLSRNNVVDSEEEVVSWAESLEINEAEAVSESKE